MPDFLRIQLHGMAWHGWTTKQCVSFHTLSEHPFIATALHSFLILPYFFLPLLPSQANAA